MKKYTFRLEAVLKLKKLKEENCRAKLGKLITYLQKIDDQISYDKNELVHYKKIQQEGISRGIMAQKLQMFPMLIMGKEQNIELLSRDRRRQELLINEVKIELTVLKGEVKVLENLKEKDYAEYLLAYKKDLNDTIEEQTRNWMNYSTEEEV